VFPLKLIRAMFIGMDPPRHDRLKMLFQAGFTPRRIAAHEPAIRAIVIGVLDRLDERDRCDLVTQVAQPVVSRVIGSFMGVPPEDDADWARLMNAALAVGDPDMSPRGVDTLLEDSIPELFERCRQLIAERRERPTDDLTSVLVHAEVDGHKLAEQEIVMGFFLLMAAGNDSTKATYCSGMHALLGQPDQRRLLLEDPSLIPSAVEESLRMFPAFAHFARTATRDTELAGQPIGQGEKVVMWYVSSGRDGGRYPDPDRFDVRRNPEHQAFGAGGRHFCLGAALARLELRVLFEETLSRYPNMELAGEPTWVLSTFVNQLKTLPVRLGQKRAGSHSCRNRQRLALAGERKPSMTSVIRGQRLPDAVLDHPGQHERADHDQDARGERVAPPVEPLAADLVAAGSGEQGQSDDRPDRHRAEHED
jgi:cholest-4-en-3-one 26-monooxygenase